MALQFIPVLQYVHNPKENRRHVIRNVRKLLNGALVGNVEIDAMGSMGVNVTSSTTDADLVFVITANQLQRTPCIMLSATRGSEPSAKLIIDLTVIAGGGDGTPVVGSTGATGADSTVPGPASTVPGPASTVPGATGADSTVPGATGANSTVPGATGADSTVPGATGADSTVPGATGADSTVPGATGQSTVGATGATGADSNVPGPASTVLRVLTQLFRVQSIVGATGPFHASTVPGASIYWCHGSYRC